VADVRGVCDLNSIQTTTSAFNWDWDDNPVGKAIVEVLDEATIHALLIHRGMLRAHEKAACGLTLGQR
jgi:hypothetical protein